MADFGAPYSGGISYTPIVGGLCLGFPSEPDQTPIACRVTPHEYGDRVILGPFPRMDGFTFSFLPNQPSEDGLSSSTVRNYWVAINVQHTSDLYATDREPLISDMLFPVGSGVFGSSNCQGTSVRQIYFPCPQPEGIYLGVAVCVSTSYDRGVYPVITPNIGVHFGPNIMGFQAFGTHNPYDYWYDAVTSSWATAGQQVTAGAGDMEWGTWTPVTDHSSRSACLFVEFGYKTPWAAAGETFFKQQECEWQLAIGPAGSETVLLSGRMTGSAEANNYFPSVFGPYYSVIPGNQRISVRIRKQFASENQRTLSVVVHAGYGG